jgi:hypothetical protein
VSPSIIQTDAKARSLSGKLLREIDGLNVKDPLNPTVQRVKVLRLLEALGSFPADHLCRGGDSSIASTLLRLRLTATSHFPPPDKDVCEPSGKMNAYMNEHCANGSPTVNGNSRDLAHSFLSPSAPRFRDGPPWIKLPSVSPAYAFSVLYLPSQRLAQLLKTTKRRSQRKEITKARCMISVLTYSGRR